VTPPGVRDALLALLAVAAAAVAFSWLPGVYFVADDFLHLYEIVNLPPLAFFLNPHGGHLNVVRNVVFSITHAVAGHRSEWFMATVLVTHLLNVWLLFRVIRRYTASAVLACLGGVLWGSAPDAEGTLGWYSVYGQVLATTMLLVVLQAAGKYADGDRTPPAATVLTWLVLAWVGAMCFATGLTFGVLLPVVLGLLVPGAWRARRTRQLLLLAPIGVVTLYLAVPAAHTWLDPIRSQPNVGNFLLEAWWLRLPIWTQLWTLATLLGRGLSGLVEMRGAPQAGFQTLALVLWLVGCAACLWRGSTTERRRLLAFGGLSIAVYAVLLAGRGFVPKLLLVPRYHYYAQVPLLLTVALALGRLLPRWTPPPALAVSGMFALTIIIVGARGPHAATPERTQDQSRAHMERFDAAVTAMAAASTEEVLYVANAPKMLTAIRMSSARFPGHAALFCILHPDGTVAGKAVRFVDPDPSALAGAAGGRCSGAVVIGAAPPGAAVVSLPPPARR